MGDASRRVLRREEQPAVACPHCAAHTAQVRSVATDKNNRDVVNLSMFCRTCNEAWIVQRETNDDEKPPA